MSLSPQRAVRLTLGSNPSVTGPCPSCPTSPAEAGPDSAQMFLHQTSWGQMAPKRGRVGDAFMQDSLAIPCGLFIWRLWKSPGVQGDLSGSHGHTSIEPRRYQHPCLATEGGIHSPLQGTEGNVSQHAKLTLEPPGSAVHLSKAGIRAEHMPWWDLTQWEGIPGLQFCLLLALSHCSQLPSAISHIFQLCFVKNSLFSLCSCSPFNFICSC